MEYNALKGLAFVFALFYYWPLFVVFKSCTSFHHQGLLTVFLHFPSSPTRNSPYLCLKIWKWKPWHLVLTVFAPAQLMAIYNSSPPLSPHYPHFAHNTIIYFWFALDAFKVPQKSRLNLGIWLTIAVAIITLGSTYPIQLGCAFHNSWGTKYNWDRGRSSSTGVGR